MDPYSNYGSLSPLTGAQEERVVGLEETMETSCNLDSIISQMMETPAMSPPPTASTKSVTASTIKSTCSPLPALMACSQGDNVIHPNHVKKKGLEAAPEIETSLLKRESFPCIQERQSDSRVHIESTSPPLNAIEGVGLVVDPALANLPPELKNVDKIIIICNKDNLNTVLNSQSVIQQAVEPLQEPLITQSYQHQVATPDSFTEFFEEKTMNLQESCNVISEDTGAVEVVYSDPPHAISLTEQNMMTVKEEPAESFSVEQIKEMLATATFPQGTVVPEVPQTTCLSVNLPCVQEAQETFKTPDIFLGNDGSFDLLQYLTKDDELPAEEFSSVSQSTATNANPFHFPTVTAEVQVPQPLKRKIKEEEPSTSKKMTVEVTVTPQIQSHAPVQRMAKKTKGSSRKPAMSHYETRRKNNIASKRSRDNRKQKQLDNDRLLVELTETNEKLKKKYESLGSLVLTMRELLLNSRWR